MSQAYICVTCGTQFSETASPPRLCPICSDERQYIGREGQKWISMSDLQRGHTNEMEPEEGLIAIRTQPHFAIGQRALLIQTVEGNVLWDCVSLLDPQTVEHVKKLGGISAIAISHPHYYGAMVEWSRAFGDAPIHLHAADREWVMRSDENIVFWEGETCALNERITLIRCGGHFEGGTVLYRTAVADQPAMLLTSDIIPVCADGRHLAFMWSFPNYIPLKPSAVRQILAAVEPFDFDRIYGAFHGDIIRCNAKEVLARSAERYFRAIAD